VNGAQGMINDLHVDWIQLAVDRLQQRRILSRNFSCHNKRCVSWLSKY